MDILNELAERFAITLDSELCNDSNYLKATAQLHELSEGLPTEVAKEFDDITAGMTTAAFNAGFAQGFDSERE